ncbi:hypothetical protein [Streptomyces formicae]|nr:hypothetical protein [Streptomyces formicae]
MLQGHVWTTVLNEAGFTGIHVEELPADTGPRAAATFLIDAKRPAV